MCSQLYLEVTDLFWSKNQQAETDILWCTTFGRGMFASSTVLGEAFVALDNNGPQIGSRPFPFNSFLNAIGRAGGQGTDIIFIGDGVHNEISSSTLFDKPVLIKNELNSGQSAIIE